jgi:hypothetical protein
LVLKATLEQAAARRQKYVTPGGGTTFISTYLGTNKMELLAQGRTLADAAAAAAGEPMAYLVEQAPGDTVDAHFHQVDQFQVFLGGSGRIGTHALHGVTVHYAAACSPYGPIVAGPDGVSYLTLRCDWDPGAQWMPGAAAALRGMKTRRHATFTSPPLQRCDDLSAVTGVAARVVMPSEHGGAGAWLVQAGPKSTVCIDAAGSSSFCVVLAGSLCLGDEEFGSRSCLFLQAGESLSATAGAAGVELVRVQFAGTPSARVPGEAQAGGAAAFEIS